MILLFISNVVVAGSPYNSASSNYIRKNWTSSTTWASGNIPPTSSFTTNDQININYGSPYQSIKYAGTLNLQAGSNVSLTIATGDTLICDGLTITSGCNVTINGVLIVNGNFTNSGGITVGNTIIVKGNLDNTSGNINNGTTYTFGTVINAGSGSSTRKTQTDFNTDFASSSNVYKSSSNAASWYVATYTWDGGGADNNWMTAANWVGDVAPTGDENLVFAGSTRTSPVNNFTAGTSFKSISFSSGASNFTLSGNAFTLSGGATAITASNTSNTMTINNNITINTADPTITTSTGGSLTIAGTIANGGYLITVAGTGTTTMSGVISGTGGLTIYTAIDNLTVASGVNTFTGIVTITAGGLRITNASGLGSGTKTTVITWGTWGQPNLRLDGSGGNISLPSTLSFLTSTHDGNFGGIVNEAGNNTIAGNFSLTNGGGETRFLVNAGTLTVSGTITPTMSGRGIYFDGAGNGTFSGVFADGSYAPTLIKQGSGTWTISGANTYTGTTTITGGTLKLGATGVIPNVSAVTVTSPGILDMNTFSETVGSITGTGTIDNVLGAGTPTLTCGGDNSTTTFSGTIQNTTGTLSITKTGSGTLTLSGGNNLTYDGATSVSVGTLILVDCGALASGTSPASFDISSGAVLEFNANSNTLNLGSTATSGTVITGTGTLRKTGGWPLGLCNQGSSSYKVYLNMTGGLIDIEGGVIMNGGWAGGEWTNNKAGLYIASGARFDVWSGNTVYIDALTGSGLIEKGQGGAVTINVGVNNGSGTFSGIIQNPSGSILITKQGSGTQTLSGANTYTGTTTITGGTLKLGAAGVIPNVSAVTVTSPGILDMNTFSETVGSIAGTGTIDNVLGAGTPTLTCGGDNSNTIFSGILQNSTGTLTVTKVGSGTLTLSGTNTNQIFYINAGTVSITSLTALQHQTFINGGTLQVLHNGVGNNGTITIPTQLVVSSGNIGTINVANNGANTGNTVSFGSLNHSVATLNVTGSNGYSVTIPTCTLSGGAAGISVFNPTTANLLIGTLTTVTAAHTAQLDGTSTGNIISGIISDGGGFVTTLTKVNTGTWTLSGANTFTGTTTITEGTLKLGAAGVIPNASAVTVNSPGILDMNTFSETVGSIAGTGTIDNVAGGGTPALTCGGDGTGTTYSGVIQNTTGTLSFTKLGAGTLILSGANTYSGITTISAGTLQIGAGSTTGILPGNVTNNSILTFNRSNTFTYAGIISGTGAVNQIGSGLLTISGANSYDGLTTVGASSSLYVANNLALGSTIGGTELIAGPSASTTNLYLKSNITITGETLTMNSNSTGDLRSALQAASASDTWNGPIILAGTGSCHFWATNTYSLSITGSISGSCGALYLRGNSSGTGTISTAMSIGTTSVYKQETGTWTLSGANTYTGTTNITGGTLKLGATGVIPDVSAVIVTSPGILDMNTFSETVGSIVGTGTIDNVAGGGTPTLTCGGNNSNTLFSGVIQNTTGVLAFTKVGSGELNITNNNLFSGVTSVNAGTLVFSDLGSLYNNGTTAGSIVVNNGGTIRFDRSDFMGTHMVVPVATVTVNAGGTLYANGTYTTLNNLTLSGGSLISNGGAWPTWGTFALKGTVTVNGTSTSTMSNNGGSPNFIHIGDNTNGGSTTFNVAANCNPALVISSQIVNTYQADPNLEALSGIIKTGAGTMVLSGPNSYTGLTSINGGTLKLGASGVIPDVSAVTVNGILDMNTYSETVGSITGGGTIDNVAGGGTPTLTNGSNNSNTSFSGIIQNTSGTLTISKTGNGTLTLSGANTYTGLTTVNGGILQLNNTSALGTNAAGTVVNNGCSLDLNGLTYVTTEPLTLNGTGYSGGGALMNSKVANASFTGNITLSGATTINTTNQITLSGTITPYTENLTITGANSLVLTNNTATINNLEISAGTISAGSSTINLYGNFTNSGTFTANTSTVSLLGNISQVIPSILYNNLTINNSNGTTLIGDATVLGTLTLTAGNIDVDGHTLTVSAISGGSSSSYILTKSAYNAGSSSGYLKILGVGNNVQTLFPVGATTNSYTPCYLQNKGTSQDFKVRVFSGVYDYGMSGSIKSDSAKLVNKTWEITPIIQTNIQAKIKVQWNSSDEGSIFKTKRSAAYFSKNRHITGDNAWIAQASDPVIGSGPYSIVTSGWITTFSNGGVACDGALPIELRTFTVKKQGNNVSIDWTTMSETNNDHFTLERSTDGETWDVINICSGAGNSTQEHRYSFIDYDPSNGIDYYRLKQTDVDGAFTYSNIESVKFTNDYISMQVYPTPATADEIKIVINSLKNSNAHIEIYDTYSRQLYKGEIELSPDPLYLKLTNFCSVNPGIYYLTMTCGDMVLRKVFEVE